MRVLFAPVLIVCCAPALARDCKLDGVDINPDNASYYAGKSGRILCYDEAGEVISEEEVRDGEMIGYERRKDLWGNWSERTTNANGNSHGVAKEFWPDGTLKSQATYDDGDIVGTSKSFHKNGKLARLANSGGAVLEYDDAGRLQSLRCAGESLLPEDREPCGFRAETTTVLHRHGKPSERVTYRGGTLLRHESIDASGAVAATAAREGNTEVRRTNHPNGTLASELRVVDGYHVEEREWYMNGQLKSHIVLEPSDRTPRIETKTYRDDGTPATHEITKGRARVSVTRFDEAGRQKQIEDFAPEGHLARRRTFAPDGALLSDEAFYPDGSRQ